MATQNTIEVVARAELNIRWSEELLQEHVHSPRHLGQEEITSQAIEGALLIPGPFGALADTEVLGRRAAGGGVAALLLLSHGHHSVGHDGGGGAACAGGELSASHHGRGGRQSRGHGVEQEDN